MTAESTLDLEDELRLALHRLLLAIAPTAFILLVALFR